MPGPQLRLELVLLIRRSCQLEPLVGLIALPRQRELQRSTRPIAVPQLQVLPGPPQFPERLPAEQALEHLARQLPHPRISTLI